MQDVQRLTSRPSAAADMPAECEERQPLTLQEESGPDKCNGGNLCRDGSYPVIVTAVRGAVERSGAFGA